MQQCFLSAVNTEFEPSWKPCKQPLNTLLAFVIKTVFIIFRAQVFSLCLEGRDKSGQDIVSGREPDLARALGEEVRLKQVWERAV